jgi:hypothetical protein
MLSQPQLLLLRLQAQMPLLAGLLLLVVLLLMLSLLLAKLLPTLQLLHFWLLLLLAILLLPLLTLQMLHTCLAVVGRDAVAAACRDAIAAVAELILLLAGLFVLLAGLFSLPLEWQLLLVWLMLVQLLLLLLAELSTLLLGLCCCCYLDCCCFRCFSFHHPGLSPVFLPSLPSSLAGALAALHTHPWRIHTGEVDTLIVSARFKNHSGPSACSNALLILCQDMHGRPTKARKQQGSSCNMLCVYPC